MRTEWTWLAEDAKKATEDARLRADQLEIQNRLIADLVAYDCRIAAKPLKPLSALVNTANETICSIKTQIAALQKASQDVQVNRDDLKRLRTQRQQFEQAHPAVKAYKESIVTAGTSMPGHEATLLNDEIAKAHEAAQKANDNLTFLKSLTLDDLNDPAKQKRAESISPQFKRDAIKNQPAFAATVSTLQQTLQSDATYWANLESEYRQRGSLFKAEESYKSAFEQFVAPAKPAQPSFNSEQVNALVMPASQKQQQLQSLLNQVGTLQESVDKLGRMSRHKVALRSKSQLAQLSPISLVPTTRSRTARLPFPPGEMTEIYGFAGYYTLLQGAYQALANVRFSRPNTSGTEIYIHLPDVQGYLQEEIAAAQRMLEDVEYRQLWTYCDRGLAPAVLGHQFADIAQRRSAFLKEVKEIEGRLKERQAAFPRIPGPSAVSKQGTAGHVSLTSSEVYYDDSDDRGNSRSRAHGSALEGAETTLEALAWAIIVESALLEYQLEHDMKESAGLKGCQLIDLPPEQRDFYLPEPSREAREAFKRYVECRWPIHVFALDPAAWQQNLASTFSMRREMQLALSLAFVNGRISANNMMQYARRIEFDFSTVDLNGTAVGFSHGNETFGWRFYPRFQTPDVDNNLTVFFRDQLWGGPNKNVFLHQRRLEPGIRECYAVVIMPSFVPYADLNVSTNWFSLINPQRKELTTQYAVRLSNQVKAIENYAPCVVDRESYRDGEWDRMKEKAKQLETRLPLQSAKVQVPYENTLGGFAMFNTGVTDLAPELIGWYGCSSVNPNAATTVFLVGNHFSVHSTVVIAGGQPVAPAAQQLLSRQVVQVTIPQNPLLVGDAAEKFVDVQIATPYGVTQHLLIPAVVPPKADDTPLPSTQPAGTAVQSIAWNPATFTIAFSYSGTGIVSPAGGTTPPLPPNSRPASVLIQQGDVDGTKYDVVDVTLKFDKKYGVNPPTNSVVVPSVAYDPKQNGYPIAAETLAAPIVSAFSRYFGPEDTNPPSALSTTTKLTFRSSSGTQDPLNKTTSNGLQIQSIKAPTGGSASAAAKTPGS